jgi:hypothetical protein
MTEHQRTRVSALRFPRPLVWLFALAACLCAGVRADPSRVDAPQMFADTDEYFLLKDLMSQANTVAGTLTDCVCEYHRHEWKGKQQPKFEMLMKYRVQPRRLYLKWIGEENRGQELIWGPDWNDGDVYVHAGGWLGAVSLSLDPDGSRVKANSRHTIRDAGMNHLVSLLDSQLRRLEKERAEDVKVVDRGVQDMLGQPSRCLDIYLPKDKDPAYYAYRVHLCLGRETHLPTRVQVWDFEDGAMRLVEDYGYGKMRLNVGLDDSDFDPDNPAYDF